MNLAHLHTHPQLRFAALVGSLLLLTSCGEVETFAFPPDFDPEVHPEFLLVLPGALELPQQGSDLSSDLTDFNELGCTIEVTRPFWLQTTEVYQAQIEPYRDSLESPSSEHAPAGVDPLLPVDVIFPNDMMFFMNSRSEEEGLVPCYDFGAFCDQCEVGFENSPDVGSQRPCCTSIPPTTPGCNGYRFPTEVEYLHAAAMGGGNTTVWDVPACPAIQLEDYQLSDYTCTGQVVGRQNERSAERDPVTGRMRPDPVGTVYPGSAWGFYGMVDNVGELIGGWSEVVSRCVDDPGSTMVDPPIRPEVDHPIYGPSSAFPSLQIYDFFVRPITKGTGMYGFRMARTASLDEVEQAGRDGLAVGIGHPWRY